MKSKTAYTAVYTKSVDQSAKDSLPLHCHWSVVACGEDVQRNRSMRRCVAGCKHLEVAYSEDGSPWTCARLVHEESAVPRLLVYVDLIRSINLYV